MEETTFGYKRFTERDLTRFINQKGLPGKVNYLFPVVGQALPEDPRGRVGWEFKFTPKHANRIFEAVKPFHVELKATEDALAIDPTNENLRSRRTQLLKEIAESCSRVDTEFGFENKSEF